MALGETTRASNNKPSLCTQSPHIYSPKEFAELTGKISRRRDGVIDHQSVRNIAIGHDLYKVESHACGQQVILCVSSIEH